MVHPPLTYVPFVRPRVVKIKFRGDGLEKLSATCSHYGKIERQNKKTNQDYLEPHL